MSEWKPTDEEKRTLAVIVNECVDAIRGTATLTKEGFADWLRSMANKVEGK